MRQNLEPELKYIPRHQGSLFLIVTPAPDIELGLYNKQLKGTITISIWYYPNPPTLSSSIKFSELGFEVSPLSSNKIVVITSQHLKRKQSRLFIIAIKTKLLTKNPIDLEEKSQHHGKQGNRNLKLLGVSKLQTTIIREIIFAPYLSYL